MCTAHLLTNIKRFAYLFENSIILSTVIGRVNQMRLQERTVGRTDGHTPSLKKVSNKSSSLHVGSAKETFAIKANLVHMS